MNALPRFMSKIQPEQKRDAIYLSKFIAGAAIGLFDASLNFVWDEVVVNLRKKIVYFGLDLFFDNAVESRKRPFYQTEDDLSGIKDRTMLVHRIIISRLYLHLILRQPIQLLPDLFHRACMSNGKLPAPC